MKREVRQSLIWVICAVLVVITISGCSKQQQSDTKQNRLMSAELQKQITERDKTIKVLKNQIAECQDENAVLKRETEKYTDALGEEAMKMFEENLQLQEENNGLKKQIEELKK